MDTTNPHAAGFAIRDGEFIALGGKQDLDPFIDKTTSVTDLSGAFVMPGIHDAHTHAQMVVEMMSGEIFDPALPWSEISQKLADAHKNRPEGQWLFGGNLPWLTDIIGDNEDVKAHYSVLDDIIPDRPAAFWDIGGHAILANSAALEAAGITKDTPDPTGGTIERDENGEPTGVLRELACNLVTEIIPPLDDEAFAKGLDQAYDQLNAVGITSVNEVWAYPITLRALQKLDRQDKLDMRVTVAVAHPLELVTPAARKAAEDALRDRAQYESENVKIPYAKYVLDGSAGGQTLAMVDPYVGTDFRGEFRNPEDAVMREVSRLHGEGLGAVLHAVGDRAVRVALNAVEQARKDHGDTGARHVIAHTVFVNPEDMHRFKELGVIAELSPYFWMPSEGLDIVVNDIGEERANWGWPVRELSDQGVHLAAGADWPVVMDPNPFPAIEALVTRKRPGQKDDTPYGAQHAIDLKTALEVFTKGGAYELFQEDQTGSIEVGKRADFIVLDKDITAVDIYDVHKTRVLETYIGGRRVFELKEIP